jgi:hypothetical protein
VNATACWISGATRELIDIGYRCTVERLQRTDLADFR